MTVIKIKNSNVPGKTPSSTDIEIGELAVNLADKKIYTKKPGNTIIQLASAPAITVADTPPTAPKKGDLWYDNDATGTARTYIWIGSTWVDLSP